MKRFLFLIILIFTQEITAQHIYQNRKFFGGSFYINTDALKDVIIDNNTKDINGTEYWNNSPFTKGQGKDTEIRGKMRANIVYGYFPVDKLAIGGSISGTSNSFNQEDTLFLLSNKSYDFVLGPFIRYYIELGIQPYEIGAIFLETAYHYGGGDSEDNIKLNINDSISISASDSYSYTLSIIKTKIGFSWYLSDFISHNWFTGALLSLEPSISYNWTTKKDIPSNREEERIQKYRGIRFDLALIAYL